MRVWVAGEGTDMRKAKRWRVLKGGDRNRKEVERETRR